MKKCETEAPVPREIEPGHVVVCHLFDDMPEQKAQPAAVAVPAEEDK